MKILFVGPKTEKRDKICKALLEAYPDVELIFKDSAKDIKGVSISGCWVDELASMNEYSDVMRK